jgi:hypothetical protein
VIQNGCLIVTVAQGDKPQFFRLRKIVSSNPAKVMESDIVEEVPTTLRNPQGLVW